MAAWTWPLCVAVAQQQAGLRALIVSCVCCAGPGAPVHALPTHGVVCQACPVTVVCTPAACLPHALHPCPELPGRCGLAPLRYAHRRTSKPSAGVTPRAAGHPPGQPGFVGQARCIWQERTGPHRFLQTLVRWAGTAVPCIHASDRPDLAVSLKMGCM
jgi:hypothetical protein